MTNRASFQRLEDNSWGIKVQGQQVTRLEGETVTVAKRDGTTSEVKLGKRLDAWNGGRSAVYAIHGKNPRVARQTSLDDAEYHRGVEDTRRAQAAGPAGSEAREAAYLEMEAQWRREGFDC